MHRSLTELDNVDDIFSWQEDRTVTNSLTVQYDRVVYLLENNEENKILRRKKVRVYDYPDGTLSIKYGSATLPYEVFDKVRQVKQPGIVSNKRLGSVLQYVKEQQEKRSVERSKSAPKRHGQRRIRSDGQRQPNPSVV